MKTMDINRVILKGKIIGELSSVKVNDTSVVNFVLSTTRTYTKKNGERMSDVTYHDMEAWDTVGEGLVARADEGSIIFVEGHQKLNIWEKDGQKRSKIKVVVDLFDVLEV